MEELIKKIKEIDKKIKDYEEENKKYMSKGEMEYIRKNVLITSLFQLVN